MSETKFAGGPWKPCYHLQSAENDKKCGCGYGGSIWGGDEEHVVCEIGAAFHPRYDRDIEFANAQLIASAPRLYAALEAVCEWLRIEEGEPSGYPALDPIVAEARAALAQARGEEKGRV